jgi:hypothetical protein
VDLKISTSSTTVALNFLGIKSVRLWERYGSLESSVLELLAITVS